MLSGCADLVALEAAARPARAGDGGRGAPTRRRSTPTRPPRRGSSTPAATTGAGGRWRWCAGSASRDDDLDRPLRTFSGGELTRGSLARTLAGDPDLLLLDEPTNHLDVASLEWLEQQLTTIDAAIVLVAHDRWFLEAVGTAVLELEAGRSRFFAGPWHAWRKEQAARELALGRAIERQQAEIERLERFVTRFRAGTRSRQAQSRVKKLEKMERLERDPQRRQGAGLRVRGRVAQRARRRWSWRRRRSRPATGRCSRTPSCGSSAAST